MPAARDRDAAGAIGRALAGAGLAAPL